MYVVLGCLAILPAEFLYSDRTVLAGSHVSLGFRLQTSLLVFLRSLSWLWWVLRSRRERRSTRLLAGLVPVALVAAWSRALLSVDTSYYAAYGRQIYEYGLNPYQLNLRASVGDPVIGSVPPMWLHHGSLYGPLALSLFTLANLLAPKATLLSIVKAVKFLWLPFYGALGFLLNRYWQGRPNRSVLLLSVLANPVMIWFCLVDGHVDLVLVFFLIGTVLALRHGRPVLGALALACSAGIKIVGIVAFPVCLCFCYRRSWKERLHFLATFVFFYGGVYALLQGGDYPGVIQFSRSWDQPELGMLIPKIFSSLGAGLPITRGGANALFYTATAVICLLVLRGFGENRPGLPIGLCLGGLVLTRTYFQPWYTLWFFPLLWLDFEEDTELFFSQTVWSGSIIFCWLAGRDNRGWIVGVAALVGLLHAAWTTHRRLAG